jgi:hypothetical protein
LKNTLIRTLAAEIGAEPWDAPEDGQADTFRCAASDMANQRQAMLATGLLANVKLHYP